MDIDLVNVYWY